MKYILALALFCCRVLDTSAAWQLQQEEDLSPADAPLRVVAKTVSGAHPSRLYVILPDPTRSRLDVLDNPDNARWLDQAMIERGCVAGVNGGYFHPDTRPIGLVVSEGRQLHPFERARLLSGVLAVRERLPALLRVAEFTPESPLAGALQAGPFLVDHGRVVRGLEGTKRARRTVIMTGAAGQYGLVVADTALTLAELARLLVSPGIIHELSFTRALNLDGGSSSALWVRWGGNDLYRPELKRVRNFLCILADPPP